MHALAPDMAASQYITEVCSVAADLNGIAMQNVNAPGTGEMSCLKQQYMCHGVHTTGSIRSQHIFAIIAYGRCCCHLLIKQAALRNTAFETLQALASIMAASHGPGQHESMLSYCRFAHKCNRKY